MSTLFRISTVVFLVALVAIPASVSAQKKAKPACGYDLLPLVEGNTWTYDYVFGPYDGKEEKFRVKREKRRMARPIPIPPVSVVVTVLTVKDAKKGKIITLKEETLYETEEEKVVRETVIRCDSQGLIVSPHSFFYAGEPGGGLLLALTLKKEIGYTFPRRAPNKWLNTAEFDFVHKIFENSGAPEKKGTIGIDQSWQKGHFGKMELTLHTIKKAQAFHYTFTGEIEVEGLEKKGYIPEGTQGILWFAPKLGLVRVFNSAAHLYELKSSNLLEAKK